MPYTQDELVGVVNKSLLFPGSAAYAGGDLQQIVWNQRLVLSGALVRRIAIFGRISVWPVIGVTSVTLNEDP